MTTEERTLVLGPDNWFEAPWISGLPPRRVALAWPVGAEPALASLGLDELRFVQTLLARTYWERSGEPQTEAATLLDELFGVFLQRAAAPPAEGDPRPSLLTIPPAEHALFAEDQLTAILADELWRLARSPAALEQLPPRLADADFARQAVHRLHLRRLGVLLANMRPDAASYGLLRSVYRQVASHATVVAQDRAYLSGTRPHHEQFGQAIEALALHAPLERPAYPATTPEDGRSKVTGPSVIVLIPSYRHERFVAAAIRSALDQSYANRRVLVVDDHSPDGTVDAALAVADPALEVRVNARNLGLGPSILAALATIDAPYVALLNSDDIFHADRLARCIEALEQQPGIAVVATHVTPIDADGKVLSRRSSSAVDHGPMVANWLRWHDELGRELQRPTDRTALTGLLRCNHLLTSSNIVARTDWLRAQAADLDHLRYCLDWMVFLLAALDDRLAVLADPLVAYRLHQDNTIWFEREARPEFLLEENLVAARIVHRLAERLRRQRPAAAMVGDLVRLLDESAAKNGDLDGWALFLQELTGMVPSLRDRDAQTLALTSSLEAFTRRATDRQVLETMTSDLSLDELGWLIAEHQRLRASWHLADGLTERTKQLDTVARHLRAEADKLRQDMALADDQRRRGEATCRELEAKVDALWAERQKAVADWERIHDDLVRTHQAHETTKSWYESELARLRTDLGEAQQAIGTLEARLAEERAAGAAQVRQLDDERSRRRELAAAHEKELAALLEAWRADRLESELQIHELRAAASEGAAGPGLMARWTGAIDRLRSLLGRRPAVVVGPEAGRQLAAERVASETVALSAAGLPIRVLLWQGRASWPESSTSGLLTTTLVTRRSPGTDRAYFEGRRPQIVAELDGQLDRRNADGAASLARQAQDAGAALVLAIGADRTTHLAYAVHRLLDLPFVLLLHGEDLSDKLLAPDTLARLIAAADTIVTDGARSADALVGRFGAQRERIILQAPQIRLRPLDRHPQGGLVASSGPLVYGRDLLTLTDAVASVSAAGVSCRLEILAEPEPSHWGADARYWLRRRVGALSPAVSIVLREDWSTEREADLLGRAAISAILTRDSTSPAGLPRELLVAMAGALPIVATRTGEIAGVLRHGEEAWLAEPGSVAAVADGITRLLSDPDLAARLGAGAARRYAADWAGRPPALELVQRLRHRPETA